LPSDKHNLIITKAEGSVTGEIVDDISMIFQAVDLQGRHCKARIDKYSRLKGKIHPSWWRTECGPQQDIG